MTALLRATIIGVNEYSDKRTKAHWLQYARADAEEIGALACNSNTIQVERVDVLTNERASESEVRASLNHTFASNRHVNNTIALFYFAGHGAPHPLDDRVILCCHDVDPSNPNRGGIRLNDIYDLLLGSGADCNIAIIDACFSGDIINIQDLKRITHKSPVELAKKAIEALQGQEDKTIAIFAACRSSEQARETKERAHGIYTDEILKGWRDGLAGDQNGTVSLLGLVHFLSQRFAKDRQVPQFSIRGSSQITLQQGQARSVEEVQEKIEPLKPTNALTNVYGEITIPTFIQKAVPTTTGQKKQLIIIMSVIVAALLVCTFATITIPVLNNIFFAVVLLWGIILALLLVIIKRWLIPVSLVQLALLAGYGYNHFQWRISQVTPLNHTLTALAGFETVYWILLAIETILFIVGAFLISTR